MNPAPPAPDFVCNLPVIFPLCFLTSCFGGSLSSGPESRTGCAYLRECMNVASSKCGSTRIGNFRFSGTFGSSHLRLAARVHERSLRTTSPGRSGRPYSRRMRCSGTCRKGTSPEWFNLPLVPAPSAQRHCLPATRRCLPSLRGSPPHSRRWCPHMPAARVGLRTSTVPRSRPWSKTRRTTKVNSWIKLS